MRGSATAAPNPNGLTRAAFRRSPRWVCAPVTRSRCGCRVARPPRRSTTFCRWRRATSTSQRSRRLPRRSRTVRQAPIGAGPGLGIGPARSMRMGAITIPDAPADEPAVEWRRLGKAIASVRRTISQLRTRTAREVGEAEASIFDAHQLLLDDAALLDDARGRIDDGPAGGVGVVGRRTAAGRRVRGRARSVPAGPCRRRPCGRRSGVAGGARHERKSRRADRRAGGRPTSRRQRPPSWTRPGWRRCCWRSVAHTRTT